MVKTWDKKPLLDCVYLLQGLTYSPSNIKSYGLLVLRSSNIKNGKLAFDDCVFVDCSVDESKYVKPNDILICVRNGSSALIGKCCVIDQSYNATFGAFMSVLRGDSTGYVAHIFASNIVQSQIRNRSSATINQITKRDFEDIVIPIPIDEGEQRAIAAALSDADAYIAALERLIVKKRAVKQGTMQELLAGKRRLPGFEGEWVEKKLGDFIIGYQNGRSLEHLFSKDGKYKVISIGNYSTDSKYLDNGTRIRKDYEDVVLKFLLNEGDFSMILNDKTSTGEIIGRVLLIDKSDTYVINQRTLRIVLNQEYDHTFFYYLFNAPVTRKQILFAVKPGTQIYINTPDVLGIELNFPLQKDEQTAIAAVLSDMDAEIDALTAKLNKARRIKQGMMSELLTGRIRLVEQEASAGVIAAPKIVELPKHQAKGHNKQFDDAVMIAGIVNVLYSDKYPLGRKKVQKCLYLLRRFQDESTEAFKKKAAGPYADEVRYKGGEPIARNAKYITTTTTKGKGTTFARGKNISQAIGYIESWGKQGDIKWVADKLKFKKVDELELLATVDMAICDLEEAGIQVSVAAIKHLIATNAEWKAKLKKQTFSDANIARAIKELQTLLQGGN